MRPIGASFKATTIEPCALLNSRLLMRHVSELRIVNAIDIRAARLRDIASQSNSLTALDLRFNQIDDEHARVVAEAIKQSKSLTSLDLSYNRIGYTVNLR